MKGKTFIISNHSPITEMRAGQREAKQKIDENQIRIRDAAEGDVSFLFSSWLKSFRNGALCKFVDNAIYFAEHHKLIERLMKRAQVKIACHPENPEDIYGYICYEQVDGIFVLHYAYVKQTFRNLGVMHNLLASTGNTFTTAGLYTHDTAAASRIAPLYKLFYHPYILINYNAAPVLGTEAGE